jgi:Transglutaminase-like superfamily
MFRQMLAALLVLAAANFAWAAPGVTIDVTPLEDVEIVDAILAPDTAPQLNETSAPIRPLAEGDIGAQFMQYTNEFEWTVNPAIGTLTEPTVPTLSATQQAAVDTAPDWLKMRLTHRFFELMPALADELAELIADPEDDLFRDEIAFLVAFSTRNDLQGMDDATAMLTAIPRTIYDYDTILDYVEIVEIGDGATGDYGTTLRYNIEVDGTPEVYDLPMDVYYWHVVHPKLDVEGPDYIDPLDGRDDPPSAGGQFYREYLMFDIEGEGSYSTPMYLHGVDEADLQNLSPSARGYLTAQSIHNLEIAYQDGTSNVVFAEYAYGSGQVFATTLRLAEAYTQNDCPLLENLLNQGCGDVLLPAATPIALIGDVLVPEFQTALEAVGRWADTTRLTGADLAAFDEDDWANFKATYGKAVIMPYQPAAFWSDVICEGKTPARLEDYVRDYNVLEIHPIFNDSELSAVLTFPTGFQIAPQAANETDAVELYGRPILADMLAGIDVLWDGETIGLSGDRPLWENDYAIHAIGNWIGKNMLDNISERVAVADDVERALHPVRIAYNHYGNCGELQDIGAAAMRTALIPAGLISTINEDHVWNEFFFNGEWRPFQVDWSNSTNNIGNPGICYDNPDPDVSKNISFVVFWLGDGRVELVPERYSAYITIDFELTDANGEPIPDALIKIYSEGWMTSSRSQGAWLVTDAAGQATVKLGDWRNYFVNIETGAGDYPPSDKGEKVRMASIVRADDAEPDAHFTFEHQFDLPLVRNSAADVETKNDSFAFHVQFDATDRLAAGTSAFGSGRPYYEMEPPALDVFLVDPDNREKARKDNPFEAAAAWLGVSSLDETIYPPDDRDWTLLVTHHSTPSSDHLLDIQVTADGELYVPEEEPADDDDDDDNDDASPPAGDDDDDDDDGCGC